MARTSPQGTVAAMRTIRRIRQAFALIAKVLVLVVQIHRWLQQTEQGRRFERRLLGNMRRAASTLSSALSSVLSSLVRRSAPSGTDATEGANRPVDKD
jgi:hypothetical protein